MGLLKCRAVTTIDFEADKVQILMQILFANGSKMIITQQELDLDFLHFFMLYKNKKKSSPMFKTWFRPW